MDQDQEDYSDPDPPPRLPAWASSGWLALAIVLFVLAVKAAARIFG